MQGFRQPAHPGQRSFAGSGRSDDKGLQARKFDLAAIDKDVYKRQGVERTRKRAVPEDIMVRLQKLDLTHSAPLAFSRDMFLFSYCTRGMAFVDIAYLKKEDVSGGILSYVRHKTGQRLTVRIEPCLLYTSGILFGSAPRLGKDFKPATTVQKKLNPVL